ncbi:MAG TPA: peptide ABC transporter substrate-binding protein [Spirochaetia bacterium]|nr:peptide ABC transporter substrate-binding protein [Spirochaetia bacterium]
MNPKKKLSILLLISLIFGLIFFVSSCSSVGEKESALPVRSQGVEEPKPSDEKQDQAEQKEKEKEFVYALTSTRINFDSIHAFTALESQVYTAIYEGLVTYNPLNLDPMPGAASHWDITEDGKNYRFYLREEALYSNGDPVKAKDFKDSWLRMLDPKANAEYSAFFDVIKGARAYRMGETTDTDTIGIRAVSDRVLDVELEAPAAHFLKVLCHMSFVPIYPKYHKDKDWEARSSIVGNGPFYIYEKNDQEIVFLKNNLYWDKSRVRLDRLIMRFYSDPGEISIAYNRGLVHWASNWVTESLQDRSKIVFNPLFATSFYFFKCLNPPWNDFRVRRALALLIPWDQIRTDDIFYKTDRIVPEVPGYPEVKGISKPNREEAFSLLSEAGYPEGKNLPPIIIRVPPGEDSEHIAGVMAAAWRENTKAEVIIDTVDYDSYFDSMKKEDYTIGRMTWIGDFADPLTFLQMWTGNSNLNDAKYKDPEYDRLIQEAISKEGKARYERFSEAESIILTKAVVMPISNQPTLNLIDFSYIRGWYPNALDIHPFKYLSFKEARLFPNLVMR